MPQTAARESVEAALVSVDIPVSSISLSQSHVTEALGRRDRRTGDYPRENQAMLDLARKLCGDPEELLHHVLSEALSLCQADAAGISLLEGPRGTGSQFRWVRAAGKLSALEGTRTPYDCPSGITVGLQQPQLFRLPEHHFRGMKGSLHPPLYEVLLVPWSVPATSEGTLAVATFDPNHHFDSEDARLLQGLASYVASAMRSRDASKAAEDRDRYDAVMDIARELAHHINNPLQSAFMALELLEDPSWGPNVHQRALPVARRQLERIARIVDELLEFHHLPTPDNLRALGEPDLGSQTAHRIAS